MGQFIEWGALANIIVIGVLVGAGLPALFAVGVRLLAGPGSTVDGQVPLRRRVLAGLCFALVLAAIVGAIVYIAAGGH